MYTDNYFKIIASEFDKDMVYILDLSISTSSRNMNPIEFKICRFPDNNYYVYAWHKFSTQDMLKHLLVKKEELGGDVTIADASDALFADREYMMKNIYYSAFKLDKAQTEMVLNAINTEIDDDVKFMYGRDGHSYRLKIYRETIIEISFWCIAPKECKPIVDMINMLVDIYNPSDKESYYCRQRE